jgi:hypothetical protein
MSDINHHKCRIAALSRSRASDDPDLVEARRSLKAAKLTAHVEKIVAEWPELTPDQLQRVALLLKPRPGGDVK